MSLIGWIANALLIYGAFCVGNKSRNAFLFTIVGEIVWTGKAISESHWDLAFICIMFAAMAARNWWAWGQPEAST